MKEATATVENKETARRQLAKGLALWRVALEFGFVFEVKELIEAITAVG